jgi:hypothetical protein
MIGYFPEILPDELLYSAFARYQKLLGLPSSLALRAELGIATMAVAVSDLPGHLSSVADRLPGRESGEDLLLRHTMFPYYAPFVARERYENASGKLLRGSGLGAHSSLGARRTVSPAPECLRFCAICYGDDLNRYGTAYWHRSHQLPAIPICPTHHVPLRATAHLTSRRPPADRYHFHVLGPEELEHGTPVAVPHRWRHFLPSLAQRSIWLLEHPRPSLADALYERCRRLAFALGWRDGVSDKLSIAALFHAGNDKFGAAYLEYARCSRRHPRDNWVRVLLNAPVMSQHAVRRLLLAELLEVPMPVLFGADEAFDAYLAAPSSEARRPILREPCRNPVCAMYAGPPARDLRHRSEQLVVRCPECDFHYAYNPRRPSHWSLLGPGELWERRFLELFTERTEHYQAIAAELGLPITKLNEQRSRFGLGGEPGSSDRRKGPNHIKRLRTEELRNQRRAWLLKTMRKNPSWSRNELNQSNPTNYRWLFSVDREWMEAALPPRQSGSGALVNWDERQQKLMRQLPGAAERVLLRQTKPHRLSRSALDRELYTRPLSLSERARMPRLEAAIEAVLERHNGSALDQRRLEWAEQYFVERGFVPSESVLTHVLCSDTLQEGRRRFDLRSARERIARGIGLASPLESGSLGSGTE